MELIWELDDEVLYYRVFAETHSRAVKFWLVGLTGLMFVVSFAAYWSRQQDNSYDINEPLVDPYDIPAATFDASEPVFSERRRSSSLTEEQKSFLDAKHQSYNLSHGSRGVLRVRDDGGIANQLRGSGSGNFYNILDAMSSIGRRSESHGVLLRSPTVQQA